MKDHTRTDGLKIIIAVLLLVMIGTVTRCYAQRKVSLSIHQDVRLGLIGGGYYKPFTMDLLARFKMQGNQQKYGYMIVFPEFEYADIDGIYKRYSANIGYTMNQVIHDDMEFSGSAGWGFIDRYGKSMFSFGGALETAYVFDNLKISAVGQLTERKDLGYFYGKTEWRFSAFIGVEINLN